MELLLPVGSVVILMKGDKTHPPSFTSCNGTVRLRQSDCVFPRHALDLFPIEPAVSEDLVPSESPEFLQRLEDLLGLGCIKGKQIRLEVGDIQVEQYLGIVPAHEPAMSLDSSSSTSVLRG